MIACGPATLVPPQIRTLGVEVSHSLDDILGEVDCINLLRVQFERQRGLLPVDQRVRAPVRDERRPACGGRSRTC
ncbi:MAG: hypothetical protein U0992_15125 [Planctomycetaceae bacterium]